MSRSHKKQNMLKSCRCRNPDEDICLRIFFSDIISPYRYCQIVGKMPLKKVEFVTILENEGWRLLKQNGSHQIWVSEDTHEKKTLAWPTHEVSKVFLKVLCKKFRIPLDRIFQRKGNNGMNGKIKQATNQSAFLPSNTLGGRIARARVAADLSQGKLGELVGVKQPTISEWERGAAKPSPEYIEKIADLFGWNDMRTVKSVRENIVIQQTGSLPTEIENVVVAKENVSEALPLGPEKITEAPEEKQDKTVTPTIDLRAPETEPSPTIIVPKPDKQLQSVLVAGLGIASEDRQTETKELVLENLTPTVVVDWIRKLVMENADLKEEVHRFRAMNLNEMADKARRYDEIRKMIG